MGSSIDSPLSSLSSSPSHSPAPSPTTTMVSTTTTATTSTASSTSQAGIFFFSGKATEPTKAILTRTKVVRTVVKRAGSGSSSVTHPPAKAKNTSASTKADISKPRPTLKRRSPSPDSSSELSSASESDAGPSRPRPKARRIDPTPSSASYSKPSTSTSRTSSKQRNPSHSNTNTTTASANTGASSSSSTVQEARARKRAARERAAAQKHLYEDTLIPPPPPIYRHGDRHSEGPSDASGSGLGSRSRSVSSPLGLDGVLEIEPIPRHVSLPADAKFRLGEEERHIYSEIVVRGLAPKYYETYFKNPEDPTDQSFNLRIGPTGKALYPHAGLEYPNNDAYDKYALLAPKDPDHYNPIMCLEASLHAICRDYLTPDEQALVGWDDDDLYLNDGAPPRSRLRGRERGRATSPMDGGEGPSRDSSTSPPPQQPPSSSRVSSRLSSTVPSRVPSSAPSNPSKLPSADLSSPLSSLSSSPASFSSLSSLSSFNSPSPPPDDFSLDPNGTHNPNGSSGTNTNTNPLRSLKRAIITRNGPLFLSTLKRINALLWHFKYGRPIVDSDSDAYSEGLGLGSSPVSAARRKLLARVASLSPAPKVEEDDNAPGLGSLAGVGEPEVSCKDNDVDADGDDVAMSHPDSLINGNGNTNSNANSNSTTAATANGHVHVHHRGRTTHGPSLRPPTALAARTAAWDGHGIPMSVLTRIIEETYQRAVGPHVRELRRYTSWTSEVYGELTPRFVSELLRVTSLGPGKLFLDLGSGVGNVVLQAALESGCDAYGCEINKVAARVARGHKAQFEVRCRMWGVGHGSVELEEGDILDSRRVDELIAKADVVLVNNKVFTTDLNEALRPKFLDLKEGALLVSLAPFVTGGASGSTGRLTARNIDDMSAIFDVSERRYRSGHVSWGSGGGSYWVQKVDRTGYAGAREKFESARPSRRGAVAAKYTPSHYDD